MTQFALHQLQLSNPVSEFAASVTHAPTTLSLPAPSVDNTPAKSDKVGPPIGAKPSKRKAPAVPTVVTSSRVLEENSSSDSSDSESSAESEAVPAPVSVSILLLILLCHIYDFVHCLL